MKRFITAASAATLVLTVAACGGGDDGSDAPAPAPAPAAAPAAAPADGGLSAADWVVVDDDARTATIHLIAGETAANNTWNYNGFSKGEVTIVIPEGYAVTVNFENRDPANFHSVIVMTAADTWPAIFTDPTPAFEGAMSANATSMTEATAPGGGTATVTFTASSAGDYALVCGIPAHAVTGMWIGFEVSASGESGLRM